MSNVCQKCGQEIVISKPKYYSYSHDLFGKRMYYTPKRGMYTWILVIEQGTRIRQGIKNRRGVHKMLTSSFISNDYSACLRKYFKSATKKEWMEEMRKLFNEIAEA
jgi:hypothetical protein